jgi:hypothetical protein
MKWNIFKRVNALEALVATQQQAIAALSNKHFLSALPEELEKIERRKQSKREYYQRNKDRLMAQRRSKKDYEKQREKRNAYAKEYYRKKKASLIVSVDGKSEAGSGNIS